MPAVSKQQAKLMRIVRGIQKGDVKPSDASKTAQELADTMDPEDVKDFAKTPDKGLPQRAESQKSIKESAMSTIDILVREAGDFNLFLQEFKKEFPDVKLDKPTIDKLKKMYDGVKGVKEAASHKESLNEEASIYKDWDEFVNPHYIIVHLKDGKQIKVDKSRLKGGQAVYNAVLKAFNDNNYRITNKIVKGMLDKLRDKDEEGKELGRMGVYVSETNLHSNTESVKEVTKMENPCWKGYVAYGTKIKDGREVPNCVPKNEAVKGMLKEIQVKYDFSPKELERLIQTMKRHSSTEVKMIAALEKALGKKVAAWDDITETVSEEDCGCNNPVTEYPVHSSNRLYLKTALNNK